MIVFLTSMSRIEFGQFTINSFPKDEYKVLNLLCEKTH